jgi:hypothetical protein
MFAQGKNVTEDYRLAIASGTTAESETITSDMLLIYGTAAPDAKVESMLRFLLITSTGGI